MANPTVSRDAKANRMNALLAEDKFSTITRNLIQTLAGNGRLGETGKVIASFNELMEASRGVVKAVVTTAEPLSAAQTKTVQAAVSNLVEGKGKVRNLVRVCTFFTRLYVD